MVNPIDPQHTARAIIALSYIALRDACSDHAMEDEAVRTRALSHLTMLIGLSERQHQLAVGVRARDVMHAITHGSRGKTKAYALEAIRALRGLEHAMNIADDKLFSDFVKSGEDWAVMRKEQREQTGEVAR